MIKSGRIDIPYSTLEGKSRDMEIVIYKDGAMGVIGGEPVAVISIDRETAEDLRDFLVLALGD